ncbi:hypothetical protein D5086_013083 [Populus alba]|uniref:Uncharacterized protein n=1 Tax=Populus alba TaxID=43335 RepID=A0ACC4C491_POPAL
MLTLTYKAREMDASLVLTDQHSSQYVYYYSTDLLTFQDQQDQSFQWSLNASVKTVSLYCFHTYHYINTNGSSDGESTYRDKIWNAKKREDLYTYIPVVTCCINQDQMLVERRWGFCCRLRVSLLRWLNDL